MQILLALLAIVIILLSEAQAQQPQGNTRIIVPAYENPNPPSDVSMMWPRLISFAQSANGSRLVVILNPFNGPGTSPIDPNYMLPNGTGPIPTLLATNAVVLTYVPLKLFVNDVLTVRPEADVLADIDRYYSAAYWRGFPHRPDGVFFDDLDPDIGLIQKYQRLRDRVRILSPNAAIFANPGIPSVFGSGNAGSLVDIFDTIVVSEVSQETFLTSQLHIDGPPWAPSYPRSRIATIVHTAQPAQFAGVFNQMMQRKAGMVYITDDVGPPASNNAYNLMPTFWDSLLPLLYTPRDVGGSISGLAPSNSLTLLNSITGESLQRNTGGSFVFTTKQTSGGSYAVTVSSQPSGQSCSVQNGSGVVGSTAITNIQVVCQSNTFTVGGNLSGLVIGRNVALQLNGGSALNLTNNGNFTFPTGLALNSSYTVAVSSQPQGQNCTVTNGVGNVTGTVTNVSVQCAQLSYAIGGNVSGLLAGRSVGLRNDSNSSAVTVSPPGTFQFPTLQLFGSSYAVSISSQPLGQTCAVQNGVGTVSGVVNTINVPCTPNSYTVGGMVSGLLAGRSVGLQLNGGSTLSVSGSSFTFSNALNSGSSYAVTVSSQPAGQVCTVAQGNGTVVASPISNVLVQCVTSSSGSLTVAPVDITAGGVPMQASVVINGTGIATYGFRLCVDSSRLQLVLAQLPGSGNHSCAPATVGSCPAGTNHGISCSATGALSFPQAFVFRYAAETNASTGATPLAITQAVFSDSGGAPVSVNINNASANILAGRRIGGTISGLAPGQSIALRNGVTAENLTASALGAFSFQLRQSTGEPYAVSIFSQPAAQNCSLSNGSGTVGTGDVMNIAVTCGASSSTTSVIERVPATSTLGDLVQIRFTVSSPSGVPTGTVTISDGLHSCSASVVDGQCSIRFMRAGLRSLQASYSGSANHSSSSSTIVEHPVMRLVQQAFGGSTSGFVGEPVSLGLILTPLAPFPPPDLPWPETTGMINFTVTPEFCTATLPITSCMIAPQSAGSRSVSANYPGDSNYAPISTTFGLFVQPERPIFRNSFE